MSEQTGRGAGAARRRSRRTARRWSAVGRRVMLAVAVLTLAMTAAGVAAGGYVWLSRGGDGGPRAVVVDQLSATDPNPEFIDEATSMLVAAGYKVDYVPPEKVTVDYYRDLPRREYDLIIVRSHSSQQRTRYVKVPPSASQPNGSEYSVEDPVVGLFTNEPYSGKEHAAEQRVGQLSGSSYPAYPERGAVFGVNPEFVQASMRGTFGGALVVLMGCGGLNSTGMADALIARGARGIISWEDLVSAPHTDRASLRLLAHLLDGDAPADAVSATMDEVGADPDFGSRLLAYP